MKRRCELLNRGPTEPPPPGGRLLTVYLTPSDKAAQPFVGAVENFSGLGGIYERVVGDALTTLEPCQPAVDAIQQVEDSRQRWVVRV